MRGPTRVLPLESCHPSLVAKTAAPRILFVQTEAPSCLSPAIGKLREKLYPHCEIALLCREDDRKQFETNPHIHQILTYSRQHLRANFQLGSKIREVNPDLLAAIFSGRPIFRKQKLFFFLLPFRYRLVFDENLDYFHLNWRNVHRFWTRRPTIGALGLLLRKPVRALLFFPRFLYLMIWVTLMKLKRVASERSSKSEPGAREAGKHECRKA